MQKVKTITIVLLIVAIFLTTIGYAQYAVSAQMSGGASSAHHISEKGRRFVIEEFGHCETISDLIAEIGEYEKTHFTYDENYPERIIQDFNFDEFVAKETGVCWEMAAFADCVVREICIYKNWDARSYIVDVRINGNFWLTHSYNYVIEGDTIYAFDMTEAVVRQKTWICSFSGTNLSDIYNFAEQMNETVYRVL